MWLELSLWNHRYRTRLAGFATTAAEAMLDTIWAMLGDPCHWHAQARGTLVPDLVTADLRIGRDLMRILMCCWCDGSLGDDA